MNDLESYRQDIIDAAVEWQSYWSDNIGDQTGISSRQGYLYDRVRHYRKAQQQEADSIKTLSPLAFNAGFQANEAMAAQTHCSGYVTGGDGGSP